MSHYSLYAGTADRWANFATRKFHRLYGRNPALRVRIGTPDGHYDFPASLLASSVPQGEGSPRRIITTIDADHRLIVHGAEGTLDLAEYYSPAAVAGAAVTANPAPPADPDNLAQRRNGPETEWHKNTVTAIAANPALIFGAQELLADPVCHTWKDSMLSHDGVRLWRALWTGKHPDVVFQQSSGKLTVIEVEPDNTASEGLAQVAGDYLFALKVDRRLAGLNQPIDALLVLQTAALELAERLGDLCDGIRIINMA